MLKNHGYATSYTYNGISFKLTYNLEQVEQELAKIREKLATTLKELEIAKDEDKLHQLVLTAEVRENDIHELELKR